MLKWVKWIAVILLSIQIINYFLMKRNTPLSVLSSIESTGCEGYEVFGMHLPFSFFFAAETDSTVYLSHPTEKDIDLKIKMIDPSAPLFKGYNTRYKITSAEMTKHFSHCRS